MKYLVSLFILFLSLSNLQAQEEFCKASSVFFDLNKSKLRSEGQSTLDSLFLAMNGYEFILEAYGYADTSHTSVYNRKLSQQRIDGVLSYLKSKGVKPKEIRVFNEGEDFNELIFSKVAAFQRRVDIYLTPVEGDDVIFKSETGVVITRELSSFGDCGICALKPKMKYLQTENEANANGIDLITDKGERLVTYGMVLFDIDTCASIPEEKQRTIETCMEMPAPVWNNQVKLFELVEQSGNDNWRLLGDTVIYDSIAHVVRFCSRARRVNCDLILDNYNPTPLNLILPEETQTGKSFFIHVSPKNSEKLYNDTVKFPNDIETVISYFKIGKDWYLFRDERTRIVRQFLNRDSVSPTSCLIYASDYKIAPSIGEIELKVKLKSYDKIGYYNPDFDLFVPLERQDGSTYYGQMYQNGFELCYLKNDRYYIEKNQAKKLKVKMKDGHAHAKIKQTYFLKKNRLGWKRAKRIIL
ncbi:OmpA family protein [Fluviicola sp.]|uniref:OmpA family protein n=1 Tax=Fluviicola sp. TaxID=1917219 RepID=UPI003D2DCD45